VEQVSLFHPQIVSFARYVEAALAKCSHGSTMRFRELDGARRTVAELNSICLQSTRCPPLVNGITGFIDTSIRP
jgi:hypothetical protein